MIKNRVKLMNFSYHREDSIEYRKEQNSLKNLKDLEKCSLIIVNHHISYRIKHPHYFEPNYDDKTEDSLLGKYKGIPVLIDYNIMTSDYDIITIKKDGRYMHPMDIIVEHSLDRLINTVEISLLLVNKGLMCYLRRLDRKKYLDFTSLDCKGLTYYKGIPVFIDYNSEEVGIKSIVAIKAPFKDLKGAGYSHRIFPEVWGDYGIDIEIQENLPDSAPIEVLAYWEEILVQLKIKEILVK